MNTVEKILDLIKKQGITEKKFLEDLGLPKTTLSNWKSGQNNSYKDHIVKIADYFGVTTDYLLRDGETNKFTLVKTEEKNMKDYKNWTWEEIQNTLKNFRNDNNISNNESFENICAEIGISSKSWIYMEFLEDESSLENAIMKEYNRSEFDERESMEVIYTGNPFFKYSLNECFIEDFCKIMNYFAQFYLTKNSIKSKEIDMKKNDDIKTIIVEYDNLKVPYEIVNGKIVNKDKNMEILLKAMTEEITQLTDDEKEIVEIYRILNKADKAIIIGKIYEMQKEEKQEKDKKRA